MSSPDALDPRIFLPTPSPLCVAHWMARSAASVLLSYSDTPPFARKICSICLFGTQRIAQMGYICDVLHFCREIGLFTQVPRRRLLRSSHTRCRIAPIL